MNRGIVVLLVCVVLGVAGVVVWNTTLAESPEVRKSLGDSEELVKTGLETWRAKRPLASLAKAQPPLLIDDQDWKAGAVLLEYEILNVTLQEGDPMPRCFVKLKFQRRGKVMEREVCYIVDLGKRIITRDPYA